MTKELKGYHVLAVFLLAFGTIIAVNLTLAFNAIRTFPGLEVKNSYVASQNFDADRAAQENLDWAVSAAVEGTDTLVLRITADGAPVHPEITRATFGRATSVSQDQEVQFTYREGALRAPVTAGAGNWNLRLRAVAADGTLFSQRIIVQVGP